MPNKHVDLFKDIIPSVDMGLKELWDAATDEGKKEIKGDFWTLNRYISNTKSSNRELEEHFVLTVNEFYNKKIQCKKYLLDYGKSSDAMFDYDDKMQLNPSKFLIYFIEQYMELCKKYLYSFKYMIAI